MRAVMGVEVRPTSGGMCPRCIWPMVICCWAEGMVPVLRDSAPTEPERITPGRATEPCSTRPTRLNCCWRMVDLDGGQGGDEAPRQHHGSLQGKS